MATPGRKLDNSDQQRIKLLRERGLSVRETAKQSGVCTRTVQKYGKTVSS